MFSGVTVCILFEYCDLEIGIEDRLIEVEAWNGVKVKCSIICSILTKCYLSIGVFQIIYTLRNSRSLLK